VDVGAETCPHYLTFDAGTIPDGATQFKCCPPERKRLDSGDFGAAWGASPRSS
jgi:allantoinase